MSLDWCAEVALLGLLAFSAWPAPRADLVRRRPHLLSDVAEAEFDKHTRLYVLTHVRTGGSTTTPLVAAWDEIATYAKRCSTEAGTLYVCVLQGRWKWYWQCGLPTDAPAGAIGGTRRGNPRPVKPYECRQRIDAVLDALAEQPAPLLCRFRRRPETTG